MPRRTREEVDAILGRSRRSSKTAIGGGGELYKILLGTGSAIALLLAVFFAYGPELRAYFGTASADDIYELCMSSTQRGNKNANDEVAKAIISSISVEICSSMRESCENSPTGKDCRKAQQMVKHMARSR